MDRSILSNDMALPEGGGKIGEIRPISIGTLAILERLGCRSLPILMGTEEGSLLENMEDLLLILYVHVQDDNGLYNLVDRLYTDPESIHKDSIIYGTQKTTDEISSMLKSLLYDTDRVQSSNTESLKKSSGAGLKNAHTPDSSRG